MERPLNWPCARLSVTILISDRILDKRTITRINAISIGEKNMDRRSFIRSSLSVAIAASLPGAQALARSLLHTPTSVPSDINAITGDGAEVTLARAAVQELSDSIHKQHLALHEAVQEYSKKMTPSADQVTAKD